MFCGHSLAESSTSEVVCHVLCPSILALAHWKCTANKMGKKLCLEGPILLHSCFWKGQNPAKYETRSNSIIQKPYFMPSTQLTNRGYILLMSYDPKQRKPVVVIKRTFSTPWLLKKSKHALNPVGLSNIIQGWLFHFNYNLRPPWPLKRPSTASTCA